MTDSWTTKPLAMFDIESTGASPQNDQVVTAFIGRADGPTVHRKHWTATPTIPITPGATEIHGYDDAYVQKHGRPHSDVIAEIVAELYDLWSAGYVLAAYNAAFDVSMIATHAPEFEIRGPIVDPFLVDKHYDKFRRGSRKLSAVAIHYGISLDQAHDAEADALAAARLAWKLPRVFPHLAQFTAAELMEHQTAWYREQAESYAAYRIKKGEPAIHIPTTWPIQNTPESEAA